MPATYTFVQSTTCMNVYVMNGVVRGEEDWGQGVGCGGRLNGVMEFYRVRV